MLIERQVVVASSLKQVTTMLVRLHGLIQFLMVVLVLELKIMVLFRMKI